MYSRRQFAALAAGSIALGTLPFVPEALCVETAITSRIKAIAFDAFPIFDPRPIFALAEKLFPGKGTSLSNEWRTRQFEYTWLRVMMQRYTDFWQITEQALEFAADKLNLKMRRAQRRELMGAYLTLELWPDVIPALTSPRNSHFRLVFLSNFTPRMLDANLEHTGLSAFFERAFSTDQAKTYKPDPRAYRIGTDALKLDRQEILFVAFAGWDAAGAKAFGYPTFWLNRQKLTVENLGATPDCIGNSLARLVDYLA